MPVRLVPPSRNAAAEYLMKLYAETEQKLIREIARKRVQGYVDYAETAALTRVRRTLQEMVDKSGKYVPLAIEKEFYRDSAMHAAGYANARGMIQNPASTLAIEQLTDNLLGQVQEMAVTSYQSAAFLLGRPEADVFRELGIRNAAQVMALGKGALTATEAFVAQIEAHGITAFIDKAGRKWSLRAYGNMAVRTTVRQAQVSAVLTRDDHDLYKIVRHRAPCEVCAVYADRIYSKSGTNPNYPPLAQAFGKMDPAGPDELSNTFLNIHPACMCSLIPWTELGKTPEEIQKARDRSSFEKYPADKEYRGKKEIEEYRQKERNRAELMRELKEWRAMRAAGISGVPGDFATFRKHYGDEVYQQWREAFKPFKPKSAPKAPTPVPQTVTSTVASTPPVVTTAPAVGTTTAPVSATVTLEELNHRSTERLIANYEENRTRDNLNLVPAEELRGLRAPIVYSDYHGIDVDTAREIDDTLNDLMIEYKTPLSKITMMGGQEALAARTVPMGTIQEYETAAAEIRLNGIFLKDRDSYLDRVAKAIERGQFPRISPENFAKYAPTHEFAHTLFSMSERIPTTRNFAKKDYSGIRKAREELNNLYKSYMSNINGLQAERKSLYDKLATIDETGWARLKEVEEALNENTISKYSTKNADEFFAEAFTDAKIGVSPSPYSRQVLEIVERHFHK